MSTGRGAPRHVGSAAPAAARPLDEGDIDALQALLDTVPAPLDPLDVVMLDGFLCGVLVQPEKVAVERWLAHVTDVDGRPLPARFDAGALRALVLRRHAELGRLIAARRWFDPWVFEVDAAEGAGGDAASETEPASDAVYPWVAGFVTALELFPGLLRSDPEHLAEPLALIYRHLDADDIEDADELRDEIDALGPPLDLTDAVEGLVRSVLLLADVAATAD